MESNGVWSSMLPQELHGRRLQAVDHGVPDVITEHIGMTADGRFFVVLWNSRRALYSWHEVSESVAEVSLREAAKYRNASDWKSMLGAEDVANREASPANVPTGHDGISEGSGQ